MHFLLALLALAFSGTFGQASVHGVMVIPFSGFGLMSRVVLCIAASRAVRVVCFMATVLPNPRPGCYSRRFPPPPASGAILDYIRMGYTTIRGFGGCNDLIVSGHAQFWTLAPLAFRAYYKPAHGSETVQWIALAQACLRDVVDKQHYSVDMILGVFVTWAVWTWLEWVYPPGKPWAAAVSGFRLLNTAAGPEALTNVSTIIFDCDGVLWKGSSIVHNAVEVSAGAGSDLGRRWGALRAQGKRILFVTNNSSKSRAQYVARFATLGIAASAGEIVSSSFAAAAYLKSIGFAKTVLLIGQNGVEEELRQAGIAYIGGEKGSLPPLTDLNQMIDLQVRAGHFTFA
ncbi:MAG: hypothetical protein WDW38_000020 [Sanguina aurantia]